jgi:hypothetical protein
MTLHIPAPEPLEKQARSPLDQPRPVKRAKTQGGSVESQADSMDSNLVRRHPLGVRPSGNALTSPVNLKAACGSFAALPDELLSNFLEYLLAKDLLGLGATCRALHAFTRNEELWRALFVE